MGNELLDRELDGRIVECLMRKLPEDRVLPCLLENPAAMQGGLHVTSTTRGFVVHRRIEDDSSVFSDLYLQYRSGIQKGDDEDEQPSNSPVLITPMGLTMRQYLLRCGSHQPRLQVTESQSSARFDLERGCPSLFVPHLCVPWGMMLGKAAWITLGVRLRKSISTKVVKLQPYNLKKGQYNDIGLIPSEREYNAVIVEYLERKFGKNILSKVAHSVRLSYLKESLKQMKHSTSNLELSVEGVTLSSEGEEEARTSALKAKPIMIKLIPVTRAGARRCTYHPNRYIAHGLVVSGSYLEEFKRILECEYGICLLHSDDPCRVDNVDNYLMNNYNKTWAQVYASIKPRAERNTMRHQIGKMEKRSQFLKDQVKDLSRLRDETIDRYLILVGENRGLMWTCAFRLVQSFSVEELDAKSSEFSEDLKKIIKESRELVEELLYQPDMRLWIKKGRSS